MADKILNISRPNAHLTSRFNPTAAPDTALEASYFGGYGGVIVNSDANVAFTFNDDLKTGQIFKVILNNTHVSTTISAEFPLGTKGHPLPPFCSAGKYVKFSVQWINTYFEVTYTGVLS